MTLPLAITLHAAMLLWPLVAFTRATRDRQRMGLIAACGALALSLCTFGWPYGVWGPDTAENMRIFHTEQRWAWLWLEERAAVSQGFSFLPTYLVNLWTQSFYGERIVGLAAHLSLILGGAALLPRRTLPVGLALLALAPTALWASRHCEGTTLMVAEMGLISALERLCRPRGAGPLGGGPLGASAAAGLCLGYLSWAYAPARITYLFPLIWLWRTPWRALSTYLILALCLSPLAIVPHATGQNIRWRLLPSQLGVSSYQVPSPDYALRSAQALVDPSAGSLGTWSYPGAQTLPWSSLVPALTGSPRFLAGWLSGLAPDVFSAQAPGRSHRQMFGFIPFVFAASSGVVLPLAAGAVALEAAGRWVALIWADRGSPWAWPGGYDGLWPCENVDPRPGWCQRDPHA